MPRRCAVILPSFNVKHPHAQLSFFCRRRGGGVEDGLEMKDTAVGSLETNVSFEEPYQYTLQDSVAE